MTNIKYEPLKNLLSENNHSDYYNLLVLKRSLNILAFKEVIKEDADDLLVIEKVNAYSNQVELYEFVKLSTNSKMSFKDIILPTLAEPFVEFH